MTFVIYTSREELGVYAQALQANMKDIGIKVTLKPVSYETTLSMRDASNFDLLIWNNPEVDKLLIDLSKEFDAAKRKDMIVKIQQLIMNDAATLFFGYETTFLYSNKSVEELKMYPMDYYWITKDVSKK